MLGNVFAARQQERHEPHRDAPIAGTIAVGYDGAEKRFGEALRPIVKKKSKVREGMFWDEEGYLRTIGRLEPHHDGIAAVDRLDARERADGQHDGAHGV
ncbi:hypothetical protein [Methylobacterium iners]|uniref:hypothetical protein n=1 Tax=Methylobacterium iners TaxID=418707 RepID=UPI001EE36700|nr:hypothetical protein [Methylobacterium iners]